MVRIVSANGLNDLSVLNGLSFGAGFSALIFYKAA
jgi:hypothetical protein